MEKDREPENWYRLDNAAKLYPAITSTQITTVFRLSATLFNTVDPMILKKALGKMSKRLPYFLVNLKRGLFWYYFEKTDFVPLPEEETFFPCMFLEYKTGPSLPFRVLYYKKKISLEISHSITDGTGAITLLKSLIAEYFVQSGIDIGAHKGIVQADTIIENEEFEDSFHTYYRKDMPQAPALAKAYRLKFPPVPKGEYIITTGIVAVDGIIELSKENNCTVTEFFIALYYDTLQDYMKNYNGKKFLPVVIHIPVNLRRLFPSKTMRNFFAGITPSIDFRLGDYSFDEIVSIIRNYMKMAITEKNLSQQICYNVKQEKTFWIRLVPLWLKKHVLKIVYRQYEEKRITSSLSNLGDISMPKEVEQLIERFEFYPTPSSGIIKKIGMLSYMGKMYISFGSLTYDKTIEKLFFRKLRKSGLAVKIESNGV